MSDRNINLCAVEYCDRETCARGLCSAHYGQMKAGTPLRPIGQHVRTMYGRPKCTFDGCERDVHSKNLCGGHYQQHVTGKPLTPLRSRGPNEKVASSCSFSDCREPHQAKGWCQRHYEQQFKGRSLTPIGTSRRKFCSFSECGKPAASRGLCNAHARQRDKGQELRPLRLPGSHPHLDGDGYVIYYKDGRPVRQHRVVMEEMLGRPLLSTEHVHHINGQRDQNFPANLEMWVTTHPAGQRVPDLLAWAHEIIDRYET